MCVGTLSWPERSPQLGLHYGNIYSIGGLDRRPFSRIIYCGKVNKAFVNQEPDSVTEYKSAACYPKARGELSPQLTELQSQTVLVLMLSFDLCLVIQENGLT